MPLFEENQTHPHNQTDSELNQSVIPKKENNLITAIGSLLPFVPLVFEQFTGQKIPAMSGTMAEIQLILNNLQTGLQTVVNNQQQLAQRLITCETSANQHLTNLNNQFNSLRLTHTKEQKRIEYGSNCLEEKNPEY
jgi:hypothetical protein